MRRKVDPVNAAVAGVASRQHGIVTAAQLSAAGVTETGVRRRVESQRLHRLYRGVYAVGHRASSREATWMAAVLSCGSGAVLSHTSAAVLWALLKPTSGPAHVSLPSRSGLSRRSGLVIHRPRSLPPSDRTRRAAIPVTTVPRTLADLASTRLLEPRLLRRAIRQAEFRGYAVPSRIRAKTRRSRSDLELDFLAFCEDHHLPPPEVNVRVGKYTVDFLWRDASLVVETDDYLYHQGEVAFEDDRERELVLRAAGLRTSRVTGTLLDDSPDLVAADLRRELSFDRL